MWNLKNKKAENKPINAENRGEESKEWAKWVKESRRYRLPGMNKSKKYKVQHREYSQ